MAGSLPDGQGGNLVCVWLRHMGDPPYDVFSLTSRWRSTAECAVGQNAAHTRHCEAMDTKPLLLLLETLCDFAAHPDGRRYANFGWAIRASWNRWSENDVGLPVSGQSVAIGSAGPNWSSF